MNAPGLKSLSKQMAWILRHEAERLGMQIDPEGYVSMEELLAVLRRTDAQVTEEMVRAVVGEMEQRKQRFGILGDGIRANYGHSLEMRIEHTQAAPVEVLFHGTTIAAQPNILLEGLRPMQRQYVHLTPDAALARLVGSRHGKPSLLSVDAARAHAEGVAFFKANRNFWLAAYVPAQYLSVI